jgi:hypothetical protein
MIMTLILMTIPHPVLHAPLCPVPNKPSPIIIAPLSQIVKKNYPHQEQKALYHSFSHPPPQDNPLPPPPILKTVAFRATKNGGFSSDENRDNRGASLALKRAKEVLPYSVEKDFFGVEDGGFSSDEKRWIFKRRKWRQ